MKKLIVTALFLCAGVTLWATAEQRAEDLRTRQRELAAQINDYRTQMMRDNDELKRLHDEKMKINRKMTIIMESDPKLFELMQSYAELDLELQRLQYQISRGMTDSAPVDSPLSTRVDSIVKGGQL